MIQDTSQRRSWKKREAREGSDNDNDLYGGVLFSKNTVILEDVAETIQRDLRSTGSGLLGMFRSGFQGLPCHMDDSEREEAVRAGVEGVLHQIVAAAAARSVKVQTAQDQDVKESEIIGTEAIRKIPDVRANFGLAKSVHGQDKAISRGRHAPADVSSLGGLGVGTVDADVGRAESLVSGMEMNLSRPSLVSLQLSHNCIADAGAAVLALCLTNPEDCPMSLRHLDLSVRRPSCMSEYLLVPCSPPSLTLMSGYRRKIALFQG